MKKKKNCINVQQFHLHDRQLPYNARVEVRNAINSFIIINFKGITHFLEFEVFMLIFYGDLCIIILILFIYRK